MEIQEEMFAPVAEWKSFGLTKKAFLADRPIGLPKFNYRSHKRGWHMAGQRYVAPTEA